MPLSAGSFFYQFLDHFQGSYTRKILLEAISLLGQLWPYLLLGIAASTLLKLFITRQKMAGFFSRTNFTASILLASLIGVVSPLGSYIMIPMAAALLGLGVPLAVLMALMVASPLINPNLFILTAGAMGTELALMRTVSAFLLGALAGYATLWLERKQWIRTENLVAEGFDRSIGSFSGAGDERSLRGFLREFYKMSLYVGKYFFLAIILAAVIKIAVNPKFIVKLFDSDNLLSVIISTGAGVPFYVCGGAAIPVVQQLADLGMSKGAVLAFFISGPVSKISNLVIMQASFKKSVLFLYLACGIAGAMILGFLYNLL
jgi:uncharacterized membrane protein YraQ (UPF0718 family)